MNALLIGETTFPFHSIDDKGPELVAAIGDAADVTVTTDRDDLSDLSDYDLLIDYLTDSDLTAEQLEGLLAFVRRGGGYLGVHCAADLHSTAPSDPDDLIDTRSEPIAELEALLGGRFVGHPEQTTFGVEIVTEHPVTAGVDDFEVFDEPYRVAVDEEVTVLAEMDHPDLRSYPVAWVRLNGDGRVCYVSLGHTDESLRHDGTRRLLRNAVSWVTG
ncbi:ThuA domain-containing protein [Halosolutus gelatinilyticus]|uniref:ThuA domain-containing protein n=1 Tax=Halosolutus gelatinilyticus TaxID=2931975 RepID=UPI001FF19FA7|nr:ThuA domain-containing protein [Halosolutus gelatinilyticus]